MANDLKNDLAKLHELLDQMDSNELYCFLGFALGLKANKPDAA